MKNATEITINFSRGDIHTLVEMFRLLQVLADGAPEKLPEPMTLAGLKWRCREMTLKIWGASQAKYSCPPAVNSLVAKILATGPEFTESLRQQTQEQEPDA